LALLGSFLPWITATAAFVGTISRNGFDGGGDGILTAALGLLIGLMGIAILARSGSSRTARIGALVGGILLGIVAILDIQGVNERLRGLEDAIVGSLGTGLIVVAFAAVVTVIGTFIPSSRGSASR